MIKHAVFLLALALAGMASAQSGSGGTVKSITPQELHAQLGHLHVIDVNEADNYAFAHVPGAKLLAYDGITPDALPSDKSSRLVFYCWSPECPAAGMAAETAVKLGFSEVYCMHAGITGWEDAGFPTEP